MKPIAMTISLLMTGVLWTASVAVAQPAAATAAPVAAIADAPANTWVKVQETETGGREQPAFLYAPNIRKFVLATGMQSRDGVRPRHYDTEEFDIATGKWINAYPPSVAAGRPESGPVGDDYAKACEKYGYSGTGCFYKDGDAIRLGAGGQWMMTRTTYDWCYVPDNGRIYVSMGDKTLAYDTTARTWEDLKTKPRTKGMVWGSLCYDPVNKEILHTGGGSGSAEVSTWAYSVSGNEWRELEFPAAKMKELYARTASLCWQAKTLTGGCCNRFTISQTAAEAKLDLGSKATELAAAAEKLAVDIAGAGLTGSDKTAGEVAIRRLNEAAGAWEAARDKLAGEITPQIIASTRVPRIIVEQAQDALATEPPGRARSQAVYDPIHKKIVVFGGDGLDRTLSDTWLYDCSTRTWEQRFPARAPLPRAGHIMAWLPKAGKIVMAGGYSRNPLAQEIWTYDVAANEWKLLRHMPLAGEGERRYSPNAPRTEEWLTQVGAVNEEDVLVCPTGSDQRRTTWACKIDAAKVDETDMEGNANTPGSYTCNRIDPAAWEAVAAPDAAKTTRFLNSLAANQWTSLKFPRYAPGANNRWGTTAYDTDRHQFLFWGGGHATSHDNDVAHYSVMGNCWTIGYAPDAPIEIVYAAQPTTLSFRDRAQVPVHAYKAYMYDPCMQKMFYFDRAYNVEARDWESAPYPGLVQNGCMHTFMTATPEGAVTYSRKGLYRLDAKTGTWQKMPWNGPDFGDIYSDGHTLRYDCKRDCLWFANNKIVMRYDMATGKAENVPVVKPKALGEFLFWSEAVYLPDADLLLLMNMFHKPDGKVSNVAWSCADGKFYWVNLAFREDDKEVEFKEGPFSWSDAMAYDPQLKLVLLNHSSARKVWALRFDRQTALLEEVKD